MSCKYHREKNQERPYFRETCFSLALSPFPVDEDAGSSGIPAQLLRATAAAADPEKKGRALPPLGRSFPWRGGGASLNDSKLKIVDLHASLKPLCNRHFHVVNACLQGHLGCFPRQLQLSKLDLLLCTDVCTCCLLGRRGWRREQILKSSLH